MKMGEAALCSSRVAREGPETSACNHEAQSNFNVPTQYPQNFPPKCLTVVCPRSFIVRIRQLATLIRSTPRSMLPTILPIHFVLIAPSARCIGMSASMIIAKPALASFWAWQQPRRAGSELQTTRPRFRSRLLSHSNKTKDTVHLMQLYSGAKLVVVCIAVGDSDWATAHLPF
jgi:hypothetical protein